MPHIQYPTWALSINPRRATLSSNLGIKAQQHHIYYGNNPRSLRRIATEVAQHNVICLANMELNHEKGILIIGEWTRY